MAPPVNISNTTAGGAVQLPPSTILNENLGPMMNGVNWTLIVVSAMFLGLRIYCKLSKSGGLWWDDHFLILAWLATVMDSITVSVTVALGFGKHVFAINPANLPAITYIGSIGATAAILAVGWSKTSFAITLLRLTSGKTKAFVWFIIISMNLAMTFSAIFTWAQCRPANRYWDHNVPGTCLDPKIDIIIAMAAAAYSAILDFVLALMPWPIIWHLQMQKKEKVGVAIAMSMGVLAGIISFIKVAKLPSLANGDFTYEGYNLVVWGTAETTVTIMAASIPVLRVLLRDVKATYSRSLRSGEAYGKGSSSKTMVESNAPTTSELPSSNPSGHDAREWSTTPNKITFVREFDVRHQKQCDIAEAECRRYVGTRKVFIV